MPIIHLADRGVLKVSGIDARAFLNGLVTSDMAKVSAEKASYAALLSPQGKILFDFMVVEAAAEDGGGFFLDCPKPLVPDLIRRFAMYKLRAAVTIEDLSSVLGIGVAIGDTGFDPQEWLGFTDPRLPALGTRLIGEQETLVRSASDTTAYLALRIALGVPEGGKDFAYNDAFPHEALLDQLGGVDFKKGCYVGQEVVSRMEHRGTARTRMVRVVYEGGFAPDAGMDVLAGDKVIGRTGSQLSGQGLAILRLDRVGDALGQGLAITAGGIPLSVQKPSFARFDIPGVDS